MPDMSTDRTWQIDSTNSDVTEQLGEQLGANFRGGEVVELVSDLGGGKTTFVRGVARGVGSLHTVASPTFTISKIYDGKKHRIYHFDFYRLQSAGLIDHEIRDAIADENGIVVVEWADVVKNALPEKRITITFNKTAENGRRIICNFPDSLSYAFEGIC